jgi:hypothetical protein
MHHPDGMLWARGPDRSHRVHGEKVPLPDIAPMVLDRLHPPRPDSMRGSPAGGLSYAQA